MSSRKRKREINPPPVPAPPQPAGPDLISQLPDSILHSILSLLPFIITVRTRVLSSRWRYLWKDVPLRLNDYFFNLDTPTPNDRYLVPDPVRDAWFDWLRMSVFSIFNSHRGPIEILHLSLFKPASMDFFVKKAVQRGILELKLVTFDSARATYELPLSLLCCNTLHQLSLRRCRFPQA